VLAAVCFPAMLVYKMQRRRGFVSSAWEKDRDVGASDPNKKRV
jgi:hypothetical protein